VSERGRWFPLLAAYLLLAPLLLFALLGGGPALARLLAAKSGLQPTTWSWVLLFAAIAPLPPLARWLRPRIERSLLPRSFEREEGLRRLRDEIGTLEDPGRMLERLGRRLQELLQLETCAIYGRAGGAFVPVFAAGPLVPPAFDAAGPLPALVAMAGEPVVTAAWRRWSELGALDAAGTAALESLGARLLLPLLRGEELAAFLCIGESSDGGSLARPERALLESLAERASVELAGYERETVERAERALYEELASYALGTVAAEIQRGVEIAPGRREVTLLFVDIRGYTSFSQGRRAPEIFRVVNAYTSAVSRAIREHGGSVVEFHGDGLLAAFGAPGGLEEKERCAVEAGRAAYLAVSGGAIPELAGLDLSCGVGIATGPAYVGDIQSVDRKIWGVIGSTTSLAAKLESQTRVLEVAMVVDETTYRRGGVAVSAFVEHRGVRLKGRDDELTVYALPLAAA
jgi:class 3 adenylate cyclase